MLSENAVLAQFVHDDDEPILVWANEMRSLGRTDLEWYTRAFGATDSVRYEVSVTEGEVEFFFVLGSSMAMPLKRSPYTFSIRMKTPMGCG